MTDLPNWLWFVLEILIAPIVGIFLENRFSLIQRAVRLFYIALNKKAEAELVIWIEYDGSFSNLKKIIQTKMSQKISKVRRDDSAAYEVSLNSFDVALRKHAEGIYIFETGKVRAGIRDIKDDVRELIVLISEVLRAHSKENVVKNISLTLYLPYRWRYVKVIEPAGYSIKTYDLNYTNDKFKCQVSIDLQKVTFKNVGLDQLTDALNDFTRLF